MGPALFFAPSFFSPDYFAPLAVLQPSAPVGVPAERFRDRDVFNAISGALATTGEFADIVIGESIDQGAFGADRVPLAVITPVQWDESDESDPTTLIRLVSYRLTLIVRDEDAGTRF